MAGTDGAAQVKALMLRVARLAADGTTPASANGLYVTDSLVSIERKSVYFESAEIEEANGRGVPCVTFPSRRFLKRMDLTIKVCTPDEELEEMLAAGTLLTDGGNTIGYAEPAVGSEPNPNGVSIEAWTYAVVGGAPAAVNPYRWYAWPRVYDIVREDDTFEDGALLPTFTGKAVQNPNWGNGPLNDWPATSTRVMQRVRTANLPTSQVGYQAIPVQSP
jgi:hypothetical protein